MARRGHRARVQCLPDHAQLPAGLSKDSQVASKGITVVELAGNSERRTPVNPRSDRGDLLYHGYREGASSRVIALELPDGTRIGWLEHVVRHSPSGFGWGYHGSGPSDTAWSLLVDAAGDAAICQACQGTGRVVYVTEDGLTRAEPFGPTRHPWSTNGWQCECSGGYLSLPYTRFADQFVASWADEWFISRASVLSWLAAQGCTPGPAGPLR